MSESSTIEWTDATWNPVRGCTKISPGCKNCYAETFAERFRGVPDHPYEQGFDLRLVTDMLGAPLKWRKPRKVFVNSMSDLFHEDVPFEFIDQVFGVMSKAYWHTYQVLTKRPERAAAYFEDSGSVMARMNAAAREYDWPAWAMDDVNDGAGWPQWPRHNIWLGTSCEDQQRWDERTRWLKKCPAALRFVSAEPLLGGIDTGELSGIDWVIVGGESGHGARSCEVQWVRDLRDQCQAAGVPCFVKQLGGVAVLPIGRGDNCRDRASDEEQEYRRWPEGTFFGNRTGDPDFNGRQILLHDKKGGDWAEWSEDLRVRQFPLNP